MKTRLFIIFALLAFVGSSANAQWFDLANNKNRLTIGFQLGQAGVGTEYSGFGFGGSVSAFGIYLDALVSGPQHQNDNHVNSTRYMDDEAFTINLGYQIPVLPWLRIAPIIGYCQTNYGYTDMSTVNVHVTEGSTRGSIYHDYYPQKRFHEFNYGGGIFIQPFKYVEIYGVGTVRAIYGGISLSMGPDASKDK
ncbi:MAG: hypothetical protein IJ785_00570 [Bacteroidales bacterium]|nr:hypothetical protein [Bacteroidales bacterium]